MLGQLAVNGFEYLFIGVRLNQTLLEGPNRGAVGDLARVAQAAKRWQLSRSSSWASICPSDRLKSCWIGRMRTIASVRNGARPLRSQRGRGAA